MSRIRKWRRFVAFLIGCIVLRGALGPPQVVTAEEHMPDSKSEQRKSVPLSSLQRTDTGDVYRLSEGDTLGVWIGRGLPESGSNPPISVHDHENREPVKACPIVGEGGIISIPLVGDVNVNGKTLEEASIAIQQAIIDGGLQPENTRALVVLARPRSVHIVVIRHDREEMEAMAVELPEVNADIINALSRTGGVPGPMASDDILVFRSIGRTDGLKYVRECLTTRIPLYVHQDATAPHTLSSDVTLHNGDIVLIGRRNDTDKR